MVLITVALPSPSSPHPTPTPSLTHPLAHLVTYECATVLQIGRVVELAVQRYSREEGMHLKALYSRVKGQCAHTHTHTHTAIASYLYTDGYNHYVKLIGEAIGGGACAALRQGNKIYMIADDIPLLHFLSGELT